MRSKLSTIILLAMLGAALGAVAPARAAGPCIDEVDAALPLPEVGGITGKYALPSAELGHAKDLVVFAHGYGHRSDSWVEHMKKAAARGAIAFATDYRGTGPAPSNRGWRVSEGAEDSIATVQAFMAMCSNLKTVYIYGVSMGGNTSGLAIAAKAKRANGSALFDYWIAGEPAANMTETYLEATAVGAVNEFAKNAAADIEEENGGTLAEKPAEYQKRTVVARIDDIASAGLRGVVIVHGFDDGLVPYNQARELATALRAAGIQTDFYNAARREKNGTTEGSDNTTLTENVARPVLAAAGQPYNEPLAGHGTESSQTNIVIQTGLNVLFGLMEGKPAPGNHEYVADGEAGIIRIV